MPVDGEIAVFALDLGRYYMKVTGTLPDGDEYTHRLADAVVGVIDHALHGNTEDEIKHLTALLIVKLMARVSSLQQLSRLKTFAGTWCGLFGVPL